MTAPDNETTRAQEEALRKAAVAYRKAKTRAEQIMAGPRQALAEEIRTAYADGKGMKKANILRAIDHVWSRQWIDETVRPKAADDQQ